MFKVTALLADGTLFEGLPETLLEAKNTQAELRKENASYIEAYPV